MYVNEEPLFNVFELRSEIQLDRAEEYQEGAKNLGKVLLNLWSRRYGTRGSCSGIKDHPNHVGRNDYDALPEVTLDVNSEN